MEWHDIAGNVDAETNDCSLQKLCFADWPKRT